MPLRYNSINIIYALPEKLIAFTKYNLLPRTADMLRITQPEPSRPMKELGEILMPPFARLKVGFSQMMLGSISRCVEEVLDADTNIVESTKAFSWSRNITSHGSCIRC